MFKRIWVLFFILFHERKYSNDKFLFKGSRKSSLLIVFFSAFGQENRPGAYNYIWTTRKFKCNKLWIRDRLGYKGVGTYYLGTDYPNSNYIGNVIDLIRKYSYGKKIVCCGTSKGGSAALFYGLKLKVDVIVSGSPQYYIGTYLNKKTYHQKIAHEICHSKYFETILNNVLVDEILASQPKQTSIHLLVSSLEQSYRNQLLPLINDLSKKHRISIEDKKYLNHNDVGIFFTDYLINALKEESLWLM